MVANKRLNHIDLIECIAIFFVLIYHGTIFPYNFVQSPSALTYFSYYFRTILSTCVPLFFFANGYLLLNRPFHIKKHISKIMRMILVTVAWSFVLVLTYIINSGTPLTDRTLVFGILYMDQTWGMHLYWFMGALICVYVFFPAIKALFDSDKFTFTVFTTICAFLTFGFVFANQILAIMEVLFDRWFGTINYPLFEMFNPLTKQHSYSIVYFCVGGLAGANENKIRSIPSKIRNIVASVGLLASCGCLFGIGLFNTHQADGVLWDVVFDGYDTVFTFCNTLFIYLLSLNYSKSSSIIRFISCNTLGIYLIHPILLPFITPLGMAATYLHNIPGNLLYALSILCICLACCYVLKKIPVFRNLV